MAGPFALNPLQSTPCSRSVPRPLPETAPLECLSTFTFIARDLPDVDDDTIYQSENIPFATDILGGAFFKNPTTGLARVQGGATTIDMGAMEGSL